MIAPETIERAARGMLHSEAWSSFWGHEDAVKLVKAALTAALGDEFVIVPKVPDAMMIKDGALAHFNAGPSQKVCATYAAMVSAAQHSPAKHEGALK